jgi:hypothetical protein
MAFLDNSGDIILDAVLTDTGRKEMAKGTFSITKFAIGDDEIDYGLYNKNHPSGSAYYDLEILQTPVLEAFTQINANINYGLLSYARQDLLYLPSIELNQKTMIDASVHTSSYGVIFLADNNSVATDGKNVQQKLKDSLGTTDCILNGSSPDNPSKTVFIETGINTLIGDPVGSSTNQSNYILSVGLADNTFTVSHDSRFISEVFGPEELTSFSNTTGDGSAQLNFAVKQSNSTTTSTEQNKYVQSTVNGLLSRVYYNLDGSGNDKALQYSAINGPRGSFTCLNFLINPDIPDEHYTVYGRTAQTLGDSTNYSFIDTVVYVHGASTNISMQIPIRIIKLFNS